MSCSAYGFRPSQTVKTCVVQGWPLALGCRRGCEAHPASKVECELTWIIVDTCYPSKWWCFAQEIKHKKIEVAWPLGNLKPHQFLALHFC